MSSSPCRTSGLYERGRSCSGSAAAQELAGLPNVVVAGFGTDGTDGPTDAAGAIADGNTFKRAKEIRMDPVKMLHANNSYNFFKKVGGHIFTGPTGTNVNDIYMIIALP